MNRIIEWFTRNGVAANLLMLALLFSGGWALFNTVLFQEWPDYPNRTINVSVSYPGASPEEVEEAIVTRIEEACNDIFGIKEMDSRATEGSGRVSFLIEDGFDMGRSYEEIKTAVDAINTFPPDARRARVSRSQFEERVITIVIAGDLGEMDMKRLGEQIRTEVADLPGVTLSILSVVRPYEISVEVSDSKLQQYGLSLNDIARAIQTSSVNLSSGNVKTVGGDIRLRTHNQAYNREDFAKIVLKTTSDGVRVTLGDIADINDGFTEIPIIARHNADRAIAVDVFRTGKQSAVAVAQTVRDYIEEAQPRMPEGVTLKHWQDDGERIAQRLDTLVDSAVSGFLLVLIILSLFLRPSLALWVSLGIPVAFAGAFFVLPFMGVTLNLITLFAFILVLGIVVDDAIVTGENVFQHMQRGDSPLKSAIVGTQEVAVPVTFGILTTIAAFLPLATMTGRLGNLFMQIPLVVVPVLIFSLVESKLILPAHLKHCSTIGRNERDHLNFLQRLQRKVADSLELFVKRIYTPVLNLLLKHRYTTASVFIGILAIYIGLIGADKVPYRYWPYVPRDTLRIALVMPAGTAFESTYHHVQRIEEEALQLMDELNTARGEEIISDVFATAGGNPFSNSASRSRAGIAERGEVLIAMSLEAASESDIDTRTLARILRMRIGEIPEAERMSLSYHNSQGTLSVRLSSQSFEDLTAASELLQSRLGEYNGLFDISDSFERALSQYELQLKPQAEQLGLRVNDLARQVRQAFYGLEAQRIPRGREDVSVMIRYPLEQRKSLATLENMLIRTNRGDEVPFSSVATLLPGKSLPAINRTDGKRQIRITADANPAEVDIDSIQEDLDTVILPDLLERFPGMSYELSGDSRDRRSNTYKIFDGIWFVLIVIYVLLAIPFRSYFQPLIVMSIIPFGVVGAILGHQIMGFHDENLSFISMMSILGMLALSGVVINDSLVMVNYVNVKTKEGMKLGDAVRLAGAKRFRPILLTSLTTFFGLLPLMFEGSQQAQAIIPMAISLGWGVIFATFITLVLVPVNTLIFEDVRLLFCKIYGLNPEKLRRAEEDESLEPAS